ncbi:MAG: hypothetical protein IKK66_10720 [Ruminococcus sp.]|nr:hypothetical protein [Ruminococcus sp.]
MKNGILRSVKGGYKKMDVLTKLDAYMALMAKIQNGITPAEGKEELLKIRQMPLETENEEQEGFAKNDTDAYFNQMELRIVEFFRK